MPKTALALRFDCKGVQPRELTAMAKQLELKGRTYWVLSEPSGNGWKASVVELASDGSQASVGIDATADTRTAADEAAERKLRRFVGV